MLSLRRGRFGAACDVRATRADPDIGAPREVRGAATVREKDAALKGDATKDGGSGIGLSGIRELLGRDSIR